MPLEAIVRRSPFIAGPDYRAGWERVERMVCRVETSAAGDLGGTGMLVGPDLVLTCRHVLHTTESHDSPLLNVAAVKIKFTDQIPIKTEIGDEARYDIQIVERRVKAVLHDSPPSKQECARADDTTDYNPPSDEELDYALLRLTSPVEDSRGWLDLSEVAADLTLPSENWLTIVQNPGLRAKSASFGDCDPAFNEELTRLRYRLNTEAGSSGAPCFDKDWKLLAMHHSGPGKSNEAKGTAYNQGIPIALILASLAKKKFDVREFGPPPKRASGIFVREETLVVVSADADRGRAEALVAHAQLPPHFATRIGNVPPVSIADNAIGVFLASKETLADPRALQAVRELRALSLQMIPVVSRLEGQGEDLPRELHNYTKSEWPSGHDVQPQLGLRIRQLLGLEVSREDRSVWLSFDRRESKSRAERLAATLEHAGYRVCCDFDDRQERPVSELEIDAELNRSACRALLYVESPSLHAPDWTRKEIEWAYARQIAIVVSQTNGLRPRDDFVGGIPFHRADGYTRGIDADETLVTLLDREIARTRTTYVQLGRTIETIAKRCLEGCDPVVENWPQDPSMMLLRFRRKIAGRDTLREVLIRALVRLPSEEVFRKTLRAMKAGPSAQVDGDPCDAGIILYDSPETLSDDDERKLESVLNTRRIFQWVPREKASIAIPEILERI